MPATPVAPAPAAAKGKAKASAPAAKASAPAKASGTKAVAKASAAAKASAPTLPSRSAPAPAKASRSKAGARPAAVARTVEEITAASDAVGFQLQVRGAGGTTTYADGADEIVVGPPTWFALVLAAATTRRYLHLVQREATSGQVVLLAMIDGSGATRIPPAPGWQRAIVEGTVHAIASDLLLTRADIVALSGGHQPPPTEARPPYT
jgi:hypothetical protein